MIEAMGGPTSPHYLRFKHLCHTAFSNLRKNANLILNLVALMVNSGVQDIKLEPDKAVAKVSLSFFFGERFDSDIILTDVFVGTLM